MKKFTYVIQDRLGIHARPAGMIVKIAKEFESTIRIQTEEKEAEASRLMAVMGLCAKQGQKITVSIQGNDEDKAIAAMRDFVENNL